MAPGVGIVKTPRVPVPQGFGIQAGGTNAGWRQRAEHFRAANGTYAWVAYNWDNVLGNSGSGRAPARIIRNYQMPDDSFGQYRMFVEGVWCLNYYQLLEIDPDVDEKLPAGLVVMMKKDASIHIESNWKVLLKFESVITDAEVRPVRETEIASQQQPVPRMQVAACDRQALVGHRPHDPGRDPGGRPLQWPRLLDSRHRFDGRRPQEMQRDRPRQPVRDRRHSRRPRAG